MGMSCGWAGTETMRGGGLLVMGFSRVEMRVLSSLRFDSSDG
jgi:hypothetical protein